jgi:hypothetical protein
MGTSVEQIDRTYGHLLPDSIDRARAALDGFTAVSVEEKGIGREFRQRAVPAGISDVRGGEPKTVGIPA